MARIRSVHPSLFTDEAWVSCSPLARILYVGLWTDADDQGVFEWKPLQIKMRLLPGDTGDVAAMLAEMEGVGLIKSYEVGGKRYGAIGNFRKFQRPQKPNAVHPLPENIAEYVCLSPTNPDPVEDHSATDPVIAPQMEDGGGKVEEKIDEPTVHCRPKADPLPVQEAFDEWNATASRRRLPIAKSLTPARRRQIKARLAEGGIAGWREALSAVEASPLCRGENERGWRADLDFVCQPKSFAKLREGSYAPTAKPGLGPPRDGPSVMSPELIAARRALLEQASETMNA